MLKTLQITSLVALILAVCGVVLVVFMGLRKDPAILDYLDSPGVVAKFQDKAGDGDKKELESPLVAQAHLLAMRLNPPPPPAPPKVDKPEPVVKPVATRTPPPERTPVKPPDRITPTPKFSLLATVMCEANPKRSMVLLRQAGGKDEWFWQGETVGHLEVEEVRNGSAVFSQSGRNKQELFVPEKPQTKSLLKADSGAATSRPGTGGSISVLVDPVTGDPAEASEAGPDISSAVSVEAGERGERTVMPRRSMSSEREAEVSAAQQDVSSRIRRIRTVPKPPSPVEQKQSIESSISSIQEIMNREDAGVDEAQRQQENEAWIKLLSSLQERKEELEEITEPGDEAQAADEQEAATDEAGDEGQPESETTTPDTREE